MLASGTEKDAAKAEQDQEKNKRFNAQQRAQSATVNHPPVHQIYERSPKDVLAELQKKQAMIAKRKQLQQQEQQQ